MRKGPNTTTSRRWPPAPTVRFQGLVSQQPVMVIDNETPSLVINEVDADTLGIDNLEFIELYDGGFGQTPLDDLAVVLWDGATDTSYAAYDLDGLIDRRRGVLRPR